MNPEIDNEMNVLAHSAYRNEWVAEIIDMVLPDMKLISFEDAADLEDQFALASPERS